MKVLTLLSLALLSASSSAQPQRQATVSVLNAVKAAERAGLGQVTDVEFERRGSSPVYEVDVLRGTTPIEILIDARTGKILRQHSSWLGGYWESLISHTSQNYLRGARSLSSIISALEGRTRGKVLSVSFDVEDGRAYYELELLSEIGRTKLYLDPISGQRMNFIPDD